MKKAIKDFFGIIVHGCGVAFIAQIGLVQFDTVTSSRIYRDLTEQTPFYDVEVYASQIEPRGLEVWGEMKKRRCEFGDLRAFVTFDDGPRQRAIVDTSAEDAKGATGNRSPSKDAQAWGPWSITRSDVTPDGWDIYAGHWCEFVDATGQGLSNPTSGYPLLQYESNLFASGDWITTK
tara:strand:- start:36 stop:566 length:531 start_codon:yes stop_codon:yes gene_type:complete